METQMYGFFFTSVSPTIFFLCVEMILTTKSFMENVKAEYSEQEFFSHHEPCNLIIQISPITLFHYHIVS